MKPDVGRMSLFPDSYNASALKSLLEGFTQGIAFCSTHVEIRVLSSMLAEKQI
jgi:hypothetical protein